MQKKEDLIRKLFLDQCKREELEYLLELIEEDPSEVGPEVMTELFRQLGAIPDLDAGISNRIYERVEKRIEIPGAAPVSKRIIMPVARKKQFWRIGGMVAAVVLLICCIGLLPYLRADKEIFQQTAYGEVKKLFLPDSSLVVLNGNSSISYSDDWEQGANRVVRLQGEAYFKVRKKPNTLAKFQVITQDLTVEVLGTAFNVNAHKNETRVFLEEGQVKVNLDHQLDQVVDLAPGEAMVYSSIDRKLTPPETIVEEQQPSWRAGFSTFTAAPLQAILEELSQAHKLEFSIADTLLAKTQFTVTLPTENMDETMELLEKSISASIHKEGSRYIIDTKTQKEE